MAAVGILFIVIGGVLVRAGAISPVFYSRHRAVSSRRMVDGDAMPPPAAAYDEREERDRVTR